MPQLVRKKGFLILILILFTYCFCNAEEARNRIYFSNLSNSDRLASIDIFSITTDSQGFIWIGTGDGLFRYDGYDLVEVKDHGLPVRVVTLVSDSANGLWIGGNELKFLNTQTFEFKEIDLQLKSVIRTMYNDGSFLWIGTESGLVKLSKTTFQIEIFNNKNNALSNDIVRAIFKDKKGDLWVGTSDKLNKFNKTSSTFKSFDLKQSYKPEIAYNHILDIKPFSDNTDSMLWVGTETGLCLFNKNTGNYQSYNVSNSNISNDAVKCIYHSETGKLWLGTDFGLNLFNPGTNSSEIYLHRPDQIMSISDNVIWNIYKDKAGIFWFGTSNGISRVIINNKRFRYFPVRDIQNGFEIGDIVKDIVPVNEENIWIGTNNGVSLYNFNDGIVESLNTERTGVRKLGFNKIQALYSDSLERLWIGSVGGVFIWDKKKMALHKITSENENAKSLKSNYINKFIKARNSSFWISIWQRGLYRISGDFNNPENLFVEHALDVNSDLIVSDKKFLWIVDDNHFLKFNTETNQVDSIHLVNRYLQKKYARSIFYASNGTIWLGADGAILEYLPALDELKVHTIESDTELKILAFEEDNEGNLWMSSQNSILKYDVQKDEINIFILGNEYLLNGFVPGCSAKTKKGKIIFGGNDGMVAFNPSEIAKNAYLPNLVISGLKIYNNSIWAGDEITPKIILEKNITFIDKLEIPYNRSFTISFSSLHFGAPEKNVYSYKLQGLDAQWHNLTGSNSVTYSGLSPGKYTFYVRGTNNDGVWLTKEKNIRIHILPPLWRRWYFILAICFLFTVISGTIFYFFIQKRNLAREILEEQAEKKNIAAMNLAKLQFFTNISHEFRTPLSLIVGPVKKLSNNVDLNEENKQLVGLINNNASRMLRLVNQLMDFRKISSQVSSIAKSENDIVQLATKTFDLFVENAKEKRLHFSLESNCDKICFEFDNTKIETVIFNLLSNAFKFTSSGNISFKLHLNIVAEKEDLNSLELIVSDTGKGIAEEKLNNIFHRFYRADEQEQTETGTGIGLNIVKEFVELHNGKILVESTLGKGSKFKILLPVSEKHLSYNPKEIKIQVTPNAVIEKELLGNEIHSGTDDAPIVLIVEDNNEMAMFIANCLKSEYHVYIENNGLDGVNRAIKLLPDIIVSDVMMPGKSGTELCADLKSNINTNHIPIVLLTALDTPELKKFGYETGADAYVTKPFNEELLLARISGILKNRERLRTKFQLEKSIDPKKLSMNTPDQAFLEKLMKVIEENIHERDLNTDLITGELGMSHSVIYKKLKTLTGQTIVDFIRDFKLKRAAQLISEHGFTISDACYKVGFSDRRYFTRIFKQKFGESPSEYRKRKT